MKTDSTNDKALRLLGCLLADTSILCDAQDAQKSRARQEALGWDEETIRTILHVHEEFRKLAGR